MSGPELETSNPTTEKADLEIEAKVAEQLLQKPMYASTELALSALSKELEQLAQKYSLSVSELIVKADAAVEHNDDFLQAIELNSLIAGLKKTSRK